MPENQWSAAFAWPGQWLKSTYQLVDNSVAEVNRQGYRLGYALDGGPLELHVQYTDLRQIAYETRVTAEETGFADGFYLPQFPADATPGRQQRYAFWIGWHPQFGNLSLDVIDDLLYRPFAASQPADRVSYEVPQAIVSYSRQVSKRFIAAAGYGRYAAKGTFAVPIDFSQRLFFAGAEVKEGADESLLVTFRRSAFWGIPTAPAPVSPNFTGSLLIVEQRYHF